MKQSVLRRKEQYTYKKLEEEWQHKEKGQKRETDKKLKDIEDRHRLDI